MPSSRRHHGSLEETWILKSSHMLSLNHTMKLFSLGQPVFPPLHMLSTLGDVSASASLYKLRLTTALAQLQTVHSSTWQGLV